MEYLHIRVVLLQQIDYRHIRVDKDDEQAEESEDATETCRIRLHVLVVQAMRVLGYGKSFDALLGLA